MAIEQAPQLLSSVPGKRSIDLIGFEALLQNCKKTTITCFISVSQIKTTNWMQQSIVKFIALSYRHCSTCFGHHYAHHQEPVKLPLQPLVSV